MNKNMTYDNNNISRGKIQYVTRRQQIIDYSGLLIPGTKITPTDIDLTAIMGTIEYHSICRLFYEFKFAGAPMGQGQYRSFELLCSDIWHVRPCIGIIAEHRTPSHLPIDAAAATVTRYMLKTWIVPRSPITVFQLQTQFLETYGETDVRAWTFSVEPEALT